MTNKPHDFDEIESSLSALARAAFHHHAWEDVQQRAGLTLERSHAALLKAVSQHPNQACRLHDIAKTLGIEAPSVSRTVHSLEGAGLLQRQPDKVDRRACNVELTTEGARQLAMLQRARRQRLEEAMTGWSKADRQTLARLLQKLADDITTTNHNR